jgi:transposase
VSQRGYRGQKASNVQEQEQPMSLQPQQIPAMPAPTAAVAKRAFRRGNRYMLMRDQLGEIYQDQDFAHLFAVRGRPGEAPWQLALVLVFQYMEGLSDEQAAEAVRSRIDWKYALSLELEDDGFDASVLSEFRTRLVAGNAEMRLLDVMLQRFKQAGYLKARGRQRTDSTHVLAAVRELNRLVLVGETLRHALNVLAVSAPSWLKTHIEPAWVERYERRFDEYRLPNEPKPRQALAEQIGSDGRQLLLALFAASSPSWLREIEAVRILARVWLQQYEAVAESEPMCWRQSTDQPPSSVRIHSPYDVEATYSGKRDIAWLGYKVHLTESCDGQGPHLITHVLTTPATTPDFDAPAQIQAELAANDLLPAEQLLDAGYVDGGLLVESQRVHQVEVIGPVPADHCWQALTPGAYDVSHFIIDWQSKCVTCPQGHLSQKWSQTHNQLGAPIINIRFAQKACAACAERTKCTRSVSGPRHMTFHLQAEHEALQQRRIVQQTAEFKQQYDARAGIEGTLSQAVRVTDLRRARYIGLAKTRLQHALCAVAINCYRIVNYLADLPITHTRASPFAALASSA